MKNEILKSGFITVSKDFKLNFDEFDQVEVNDDDGNCMFTKEDFSQDDNALVTMLKAYMIYNKLEILNIKLVNE